MLLLASVDQPPHVNYQLLCRSLRRSNYAKKEKKKFLGFWKVFQNTVLEKVSMNSQAHLDFFFFFKLFQACENAEENWLISILMVARNPWEK